jgi:hypothetical protein
MAMIWTVIFQLFFCSLIYGYMFAGGSHTEYIVPQQSAFV